MDSMLTDRNRHILAGAIGMLLLFAAVTVGVKASFGAFKGGYELSGSFAAAGQGLLSGSDVKIRGVNVGEVKRIELVDNRAQITVRINDGVEVPVAAQAVIRPKTLFGEKFIDLVPGPTELTGPYLHDGDVIVDTLGGFELERVLSDAYPVLQAIDPAELATVLSELAIGADGVGENINRSLVNGATLAELGVSNDAEFRRFTSDLALLSEELDRLAPAFVEGARHLNVVLPTINDRADQLNSALVDLGRIAGDVADVIEHNKAFTDTALTDGSRQLQFLYDRRSQLRPLLVGLQDYTQSLSEVLRIELRDGTLMGAVKNLTTSESDLPAAASDPVVVPTTPALPGADLLGPIAERSDASDLLAILLGGVG